MYVNTTDFCVLILYLQLAKLLYFSNSFLVVSSWYIGSCCLQTVLLFQLDSFSFFLCLIAMVRTSNTIWNKSGCSCQSCFVPDHNGNAFDLSMLDMTLAVGLSYMAYVILQYEPSIPILLRDFIINQCWIFFFTINQCLYYKIQRPYMTVENSERDGNTRPSDLPLEKPVCRSCRNQQLKLDVEQQTGSK